MIKLYKNIYDLRKKNGWTQEELAKKMGYTDRSMIAKIESGKVDLSQSKIIEFARIFDVEPGDLMGWDEPETFDTPEEFEAHWNAIGGGRHPIELSNDEYTLVVNYRAASQEDKSAALRILSYARKLEEAYESKKD